MGLGKIEDGRWKSEPCTFHLLLEQCARKSRFQWLNIDWTSELNMHASHTQLNMHPIYLWASSISQTNALAHLSIYLCVSVAVVCRELFLLVSCQLQKGVLHICLLQADALTLMHLTHTHGQLVHTHRHTHSTTHAYHYTHTHWQSCILGQVIAMKIALSCQMQTAFSNYERQWGVTGGDGDGDGREWGWRLWGWPARAPLNAGSKSCYLHVLAIYPKALKPIAATPLTLENIWFQNMINNFRYWYWSK